MTSSVLVPGVTVRPEIEPTEVKQLVQRLFGLHVLGISELNSYDDRNFHVHVSESSESKNISPISSDGYVLKILNSLDSAYEDAIDAQNAMIIHLSKKGINTPRPLKTVDGMTMSKETLKDGRLHIVRLFEYLPGRVLAGLPYTKDISFEVGQLAGKLDQLCQDFSHHGFDNHKRIWSLTEIPKLTEFLSYIEDTDLRQLADTIINSFITHVVSKYDTLQKGLIHGDFNEQNLLVEKKEDEQYHVTSVLDFGDAAYSYYVFEIAIDMLYMILESNISDPLVTGGYTLAGYLSEFSLKESDLNVLKECLCGRLVQSLIMGTYSSSKHPENSEYLLKTSRKGWKTLKLIWNTPFAQMKQIWGQCLSEKGVENPWSSDWNSHII